MKAPFDHTLDSLKKINGNSPKDFALATTAAKDIESFVSERAVVIDEYANLRRILTTDSEKEIKDALTSIRHAEWALTEIAYFHKDGTLSSVFEPQKNKAGRILKAAEQKAAELISKIER